MIKIITLVSVLLLVICDELNKIVFWLILLGCGPELKSFDGTTEDTGPIFELTLKLKSPIR